MPDVGRYLPRRYTHETEFPRAYDRDVEQMMELIDEQYRRSFPQIEYYRILNSAGIAGQDSGFTTVLTSAPVGETGQSGWDPLYGETVDPQMVTDGAWKQPHLDPVLDATTESEVYATPVHFHARIQNEFRKHDLELYGFDEKRDLIAFIPAWFFDECGFLASEGDKFVWDGEEYMVREERGSKPWKNTNLRLFRVLACSHKRLGS